MSNLQPVVLSQQTLLYTLFDRMIDSTAMVDLAPTLDLILLLPSTLISADRPLMKDDVFLAQPWIDHDDTASLSSHSSAELLSLSPTHFLPNHEPLFDGIGNPWMEIDSLAPPPVDPISQKENVKQRQCYQQSLFSTQSIFQQLTDAQIDWCRYCGTTEGVNWRPGPWGKRTLCNKHGCDYKGYGLASRLPRLDLSKFSHEKLHDRIRPVVQLFCTRCHSPKDTPEDPLVACQGGCSRAYHRTCSPSRILTSSLWYCHSSCKENRQRSRVAVDLPRKYTPLMHRLSLNNIKKN
ncbi:hypothetical protein BY458DRAFT_528306 [Sporodiniella umbellata]|nr:hypothetical protein BY458DRAFT_528306 [Sporodiniella umbellata]